MSSIFQCLVSDLTTFCPLFSSALFRTLQHFVLYFPVPCFEQNDITPEGTSPWKYVNRYGDTNIKFVNYRLQDLRERKRRKRGERRPVMSSRLEGPYGPEVALGYNTEDSINFRDHPETLYVIEDRHWKCLQLIML